MVVLQEGDAVATLGGAGRIEPLESCLLVSGGPAPEVGDANDVLALGDDSGEEGSSVSIRSRIADTATGP